jgi:hypothetical protein
VPNHVSPQRSKVRAAFAARPRSADGSFAARWDTWLLPRVSGAFTGKTDEIFQWGACKWGLPDDLLRAIAVRESTWYQYPTYTSGACVVNWGCGDIFDAASGPSLQYCNGIAMIGGYDYQGDFGPGICPKTFSIAGVMSWEDPSWGPMSGNQNGTFPFNSVRGGLSRLGPPRLHRRVGAVVGAGHRFQADECEGPDVGLRWRLVRGGVALGGGRWLHRSGPACVARPRVAQAHVREDPAAVRERRRMRERVGVSQ